jgi:hypothetical protein
VIGALHHVAATKVMKTVMVMVLDQLTVMVMAMVVATLMIQKPKNYCSLLMVLEVL